MTCWLQRLMSAAYINKILKFNFLLYISYLQQSYDDCLCALDLGYPEEYHPLIKLRQASCALKMRNFSLCEQHLHELLHMELSETFEARTHELWHECEVQKAEKIEMGVQTDNDLITNGTKIYEVAWLDNTNVITTTKSAYLRSIADIPNNTPIFQEEAAVFVPSGAARICDHCGVTQFVPFPCIFCSNRTAVYCSRKCRAAHASIHALECYAHQIELFEEFGVEFSKPHDLIEFQLERLNFDDLNYKDELQLQRQLLDLDALQCSQRRLKHNLTKTLANQQHQALQVPEASSCTDLPSSLAAGETVGPSPHHHNNSSNSNNNNNNNINNNSSSTGAIARSSSGRRAKSRDVAPVGGSVQNIANGSIEIAMEDLGPGAVGGENGRGVLRGNVSLPSFSDSEEEAFNIDHQKEFSIATNTTLTQKFQHKFHRYRCDNPNCKQIFTPSNLKRTRNLQWWKSDYYRRPENNGSELLVCTECEQTQKLEWFWTFTAALMDCDTIEERCKLYAAIERADKQLVDTHELKVALARQLVEQCLLIHREGSKQLDEWELNKLGSIMRSALHIVSAQYRTFSIEYVQYMSYFWDVMALSNYKCGDKELMQMLHALEYIPDEYKEIFINYYEDYIAPKFMEETYGNILDTEV
ncbi:uncharacterized protein LOC111683923 [Lucilia cuprina]|uniref:uncharacterized protein LOC111683923 n=1 Tax=Lucilia cuprina TaxID=7375 RepID=UPI001F055CBD|nr:uncharacterized protein LOC111683923 [Lucilia cuprina]